jgi:hypothetical protein
MDAVHSMKGLAYALVSAVPLQDAGATGIGIVYRARDRSTIRTESRAATDVGTIEATYAAVMRVLEQARTMGVRRLTIYVDDRSVVAQLRGDEEVPRGLLSVNLQTRGMLHQLGGVRLVAAQSPQFTARLVAASAQPELAVTRSGPVRQLTLLPEDAPA